MTSSTNSLTSPSRDVTSKKVQAPNEPEFLKSKLGDVAFLEGLNSCLVLSVDKFIFEP